MKVQEKNVQGFISVMFRLMGAMKSNMQECMVLCGNLNEKDLMIVGYVGQNKKVRMKDIAEFINVPMSSLTSMVDKLIERNYLAREHSEEDRRAVLIRLAENGQNTYDTHMRRKVELAQRVLSRFDEEEQIALIGYIEKIAASV